MCCHVDFVFRLLPLQRSNVRCSLTSSLNAIRETIRPASKSGSQRSVRKQRRECGVTYRTSCHPKLGDTNLPVSRREKRATSITELGKIERNKKTYRCASCTFVCQAVSFFRSQLRFLRPDRSVYVARL